MDYTLFKKIASESFNRINRLVLYGFGEPFVHPRILDMLRLSRDKLSHDSEILIVSNGTLLTQDLADKVQGKIGVDILAFSIDSMDLLKLAEIRGSKNPSVIIRNLLYLARKKDSGRRSLKLGISVVLMRDNFGDIIDIIRVAAENELDFVFVSQVVPYSLSVGRLSAFTTVSQASFEEYSKLGFIDEEFVRMSIYQTLAGVYFGGGEAKHAKTMQDLWRRVSDRGYQLNVPMLHKTRLEYEFFKKIWDTFREARKLADEYDIELTLPKVFADALDRSCPYVDKSAVFVRSDGLVVPCMEFAYGHMLFVNGHFKEIREVVFGDVRRDSLGNIWNSEEYSSFRVIREDISRRIPWCGDCPYVTRECWFVRNNDYDCYGNRYSCSECLYSAGLSRCLI